MRCKVLLSTFTNSALSHLRQQRRRGAGHGDVQNAAPIDLGVGAVVGQHGQERYQILTATR